MIIIPILFIAVFMVLTAFYYNKLLWRIISLFTEKKTKKGKIAAWISSAVLGIMSFNVFSLTGVYLLHVLAGCLIIEIVNKLIKCIFKTEKKVWTKVYKSALIPLLCAAVVLGYGYYNARNVIRTEYTVSTDEISEDYKLLFVSDIHYGTIMETEGLNSLAKRLSGENADFLILGGDMVDEDTTKTEMEELFSVLGKVKTKHGVYYVSGNHDFQRYSTKRDYTAKELEAAISKNKISFLRDSYTYINDDILLVGREDYSEKDRQPLEKVMAGADKNRYIITADHQPVGYAEERSNGAGLVISGHTHAGQIFPVGYFIKLLWKAELLYGHEEIGDMDAIVSSGAAGWGYPIRTEEHSEYVVVNIKRR